MNRCNYDCLNCIYSDCVKPDINREHILAQRKYRLKNLEKIKSYEHMYYSTHKEQFKNNKKNYMDSIKSDVNKLKEYRKKKSIYNQKYRDKKRMERERNYVRIRINY